MKSSINLQELPPLTRGLGLAEKRCNQSLFVADCLYMGGMALGTAGPFPSSSYTMSKRSQKQSKPIPATVRAISRKLHRRPPKAAQRRNSKRPRSDSSSTIDFP